MVYSCIKHAIIITLFTGGLAEAQLLKLATKHQGASFFEGWTLNGSQVDWTQYGNVHYLAESAARQSGLIHINSAGNAIVKVDNTTNDSSPGPFSTFGRNSVFLISKDLIELGTLVVMDALHIPYGCSVWPAFWTIDSVDHTDEGGEINIIESINLMQDNQYSLHARQGCVLAADESMPYSGAATYTNCDYSFDVTRNRGCSIQEKAAQTSLGAAFAHNSGGVYAMYWSNDGIQMWFFPRENVPPDLMNETPNPSAWTRASASFPASGCNPQTFFNPQNMVINIDICGAWAGTAYTTTGCTGKCTDKVGIASNYDNAYWEINYVKTFITQEGVAVNSAIPVTAIASGTASPTEAYGTPSERHRSLLLPLCLGLGLGLAIAITIFLVLRKRRYPFFPMWQERRARKYGVLRPGNESTDQFPRSSAGAHSSYQETVATIVTQVHTRSLGGRPSKAGHRESGSSIASVLRGSSSFTLVGRDDDYDERTRASTISASTITDTVINYPITAGASQHTHTDGGQASTLTWGGQHPPLAKHIDQEGSASASTQGHTFSGHHTAACDRSSTMIENPFLDPDISAVLERPENGSRTRSGRMTMKDERL